VSTIVGVEELGRRIRKLRLERRMTLKQVEHASDLSATHLSEIERGRTSPTIGALVRIARALRKDASYFIEVEERPEVAHMTRESVRPMNAARGVSIEPLTPGVPGSRMFAYRLLFQPDHEGAVSLDVQDLPGDAVYLVRRGTLETEFGDLRSTLHPGDAVQASFLQGHRLHARDGDGAEVIAVLTCPIGETDPPHAAEESRP
jgi:transcriptional regulator with XRE-family HTH domain